MATGKRAVWGAAGLGAALALLFLAGLGWASESAPAGVSDVQLFAREFRERGALRFYEATEEELRLGRFEAAFLRYRFLKGRVGSDPAYRPLTAMVDHRLRFLSGQMGLAGVEVPPLRPGRSRPPQAAPGSPRPPKETGAGKAAGSGKDLPAAGPAPESPVPPASPTPQSEAAAPAAPSGPGTAPGAGPIPPTPTASEPTEKKPPEESSTPPPPSRWQRLKARLLFWRK